VFPQLLLKLLDSKCLERRLVVSGLSGLRSGGERGELEEKPLPVRLDGIDVLGRREVVLRGVGGVDGLLLVLLRVVGELRRRGRREVVELLGLVVVLSLVRVGRRSLMLMVNGRRVRMLRVVRRGVHRVGDVDERHAERRGEVELECERVSGGC
jgi:hypothetical protein